MACVDGVPVARQAALHAPSHALLTSAAPRCHHPPARSELERQLATLRQQRADAEAALQRARAEAAGKQTTAELQSHMTALQVRFAAASLRQPKQV